MLDLDALNCQYAKTTGPIFMKLIQLITEGIWSVYTKSIKII